jgi:hypothetical protein
MSLAGREKVYVDAKVESGEGDALVIVDEPGVTVNEADGDWGWW